MFVAEAMGDAILWGMLAALVGGAILIVLGPTRVCPKCEHKLPKVRWPDSWSQFWGGGWTCSSCGTKCDRRGNTIE